MRHCATRRKVVEGLTPNGVGGIFHWHNPYSRTMALGSTQPLTEMGTRNISWGIKAAGHRADYCHEIWKPQPPGTLRACKGITLPFTHTHTHTHPQAHTDMCVGGRGFVGVSACKHASQRPCQPVRIPFTILQISYFCGQINFKTGNRITQPTHSF